MYRRYINKFIYLSIVVNTSIPMGLFTLPVKFSLVCTRLVQFSLRDVNETLQQAEQRVSAVANSPATELDDRCDKLQRSSVGAWMYCQLSDRGRSSLSHSERPPFSN